MEPAQNHPHAEIKVRVYRHKTKRWYNVGPKGEEYGNRLLRLWHRVANAINERNDRHHHLQDRLGTRHRDRG